MSLPQSMLAGLSTRELWAFSMGVARCQRISWMRDARNHKALGYTHLVANSVRIARARNREVIAYLRRLRNELKREAA